MNRLKEADIELLGIIAEQLSHHFKIPELALSEWFLPVEIKRIRSSDYTKESDDVDDELVFENAVYLGDGVYQVAMDYSLIGRLYKHKRLAYNFDIQREAVEKIVDGKVVREIKIYELAENTRDFSHERFKDITMKEYHPDKKEVPYEVLNMVSERFKIGRLYRDGYEKAYTNYNLIRSYIDETFLLNTYGYVIGTK